MSTILGIDLGKFKSVVCIHNTTSGDPFFLTVSTDKTSMRELLEDRRPQLVLFEISTTAGWVADLCQELQIEYRVVNPRGDAWQWKKVARKTDRDDALKLVRLYVLGELPTVHMPPKAIREYRALVGYRQKLLKRRTAIQNRIRALFQAEGLSMKAGRAAWTEQALADYTKTHARPLSRCQEGELWRGQLHSELQQFKSLQRQIEVVERKLDALAKAHADVALLETIPGVGRRTAEAVVAHLGDPHRFQNARQVSSYAGLVPQQMQSGTTDRKGRITRRGSSDLRKILVECAWLMVRYNGWAAQLVHRLSQGQKSRKKTAMVALARKLLVRCWAMLRSQEPWKDPCPTPTPAAA